MNRQNPGPHAFPQRIPYQPPPAEPDGIELGELFGALRRNKWMILGCIVVSGAIAYGILRGAQPQYFSTVEVLLNTREERVVGVEQVVSDLDVTNSVVAGEIAVVQSNLLLGQVVDELDLMHHPDFDPYRITEPGLLSRGVDRLKGWLAAAGIGSATPAPMPETADADTGGLSEEDARNLVIWQVRRNLTVYQSGISYVIAISMRAADPHIASEIANAVAERYIRDQLEAKLAATRRAIAWLDNRLIELETQLRDAEDAVVDFMAQQVLEEGGDEQGVSQQLAQMNNAIVAARSDRAAAAARLSYVRGLLADKGPAEAAAALSTPRLTSLDAELAGLGRQYAQLATKLGPEHPDMKALKLALDDIARDRENAIHAGVEELVAAVAEANGREQAIRDDISAAQQLQLELLRSRVRLSQLERSASAMRQVYESFLARFQETAQQLEFQRADARVISAAEPALSPARPRKKLVMAVGLVLGAMLGVAVALISAAMDRRVRSVPELARISNLPVLATLPRVRLRGRGTTWQIEELHGARASGYAEGLRLLRFGLMRDSAGKAPRVILLTGADWSAGCSSTVVGLGRAMADIGLKVVILDANLRRPAVARFMGAGVPDGGLEAYLAGTASIDEITVADVEPGLSIIPARQNPGMAADLIACSGVETLIRDLSAAYDVVLIDAPPARGMADTAVLTGLADATVVVIRNRRTDEAAILDALNALDEAGGNVLGTVMSHSEGRMRANPAPGLIGRQPTRESPAHV